MVGTKNQALSMGMGLTERHSGWGGAGGLSVGRWWLQMAVGEVSAGGKASNPHLALAVMLFWSHWGAHASAIGIGAPPPQAHSHSQLGGQGAPVDPVPALGASPGPHPGVLGDRVSAQEVLRERSSWSLLWMLAHLTRTFVSSQLARPEKQLSSTQLAQTPGIGKLDGLLAGCQVLHSG